MMMSVFVANMAIQVLFTSRHCGQTFTRAKTHSLNVSSLPLNPQDHGSPQLSSTSYVAITVVDRDDRNPKFTRSVYRSSVKENYPIKVGTRHTINRGARAR